MKRRNNHNRIAEKFIGYAVLATAVASGIAYLIKEVLMPWILGG